MIENIKQFFSRCIEPGTHQSGRGGEKALQVATAALLLEMMRMDSQLADAEREAITDTLRQQFDLDPGQLDELIRLAAEEARQASGYYQFTSLINKSCDAAQKVRIVENLWRIAMCDGHLDAHEAHLMRKIADLLYVSHGDYIAAKQRAREATGLLRG
ncbi:MAG TPA: TerB family tellurite resistance protein [Azospira sp.]|nr:TerB family tellurite resistance protein [Azospira sp.]